MIQNEGELQTMERKQKASQIARLFETQADQ